MMKSQSHWYKKITDKITDDIHSEFPVLNIFVTYLACLLTPINVLIDQNYATGPLMVILLVCDVHFFVQFCNHLWKRRGGQSEESVQTLVLSFFTAIPLLAMPVLYLTNAPPVFNWISILRIASMGTFMEQYAALEDYLDRKSLALSSSMSSIMLIVLLIIQSSSALGCIWFYLAYSLETYENTWIVNDGVMNLDSTACRYFRSLYFIVQTLFTIG